MALSFVASPIFINPKTPTLFDMLTADPRLWDRRYLLNGEMKNPSSSPSTDIMFILPQENIEYAGRESESERNRLNLSRAREIIYDTFSANQSASIFPSPLLWYFYLSSGYELLTFMVIYWSARINHLTFDGGKSYLRNSVHSRGGGSLGE